MGGVSWTGAFSGLFKRLPRPRRLEEDPLVPPWPTSRPLSSSTNPATTSVGHKGWGSVLRGALAGVTGTLTAPQLTAHKVDRQADPVGGEAEEAEGAGDAPPGGWWGRGWGGDFLPLGGLLLDETPSFIYSREKVRRGLLGVCVRAQIKVCLCVCVCVCVRARARACGFVSVCVGCKNKIAPPKNSERARARRRGQTEKEQAAARVREREGAGGTEGVGWRAGDGGERGLRE